MPWDWPSLAALLYQFPSCTQEGGGASPGYAGHQGREGSWNELAGSPHDFAPLLSPWLGQWIGMPLGEMTLLQGNPESPLESKNYFQNSVPNICSRLPAVICHTYHWAPASHLWSWESLVPCLLAGFLLVVVWTCTLAVVIPLGQLSLGSYRSICSLL